MEVKILNSCRKYSFFFFLYFVFCFVVVGLLYDISPGGYSRKQVMWQVMWPR